MQIKVLVIIFRQVETHNMTKQLTITDGDELLQDTSESHNPDTMEDKIKGLHHCSGKAQFIP